MCPFDNSKSMPQTIGNEKILNFGNISVNTILQRQFNDSVYSPLQVRIEMNCTIKYIMSLNGVPNSIRLGV